MIIKTIFKIYKQLLGKTKPVILPSKHVHLKAACEPTMYFLIPILTSKIRFRNCFTIKYLGIFLYSPRKRSPKMLKILIALILVKALLTIPLQPPEGVVEKNLPTTPEFQQSVLEYWTADKMKNAKPYPRPKANGIILQQHEQIEEQEPSPVPVHQYRSFPYRVVGRVYFTRDGQDFVCSAASTGGDAVITAAHCISE